MRARQAPSAFSFGRYCVDQHEIRLAIGCRATSIGHTAAYWAFVGGHDEYSCLQRNGPAIVTAAQNKVTEVHMKTAQCSRRTTIRSCVGIGNASLFLLEDVTHPVRVLAVGILYHSAQATPRVS